MPSILHKLVVELGLNASGYELGMKKVEGAAKHLSESLGDTLKDKIAEVFGVAALEEFARRTIENADHILTLSQEIDVSTESLQKWGYAAKRSGSDMERVVAFFEHIAAMREKALGGDSQAQELFQKFGIGAKELGQSADQLGKKIADAFKRGNTQELIGALKELGGKGAVSLVPAFKDFDELAAKAQELGKVLDTELLVRLKAIGDQIKETFSAGSGGGKIIAGFADRIRDAMSVFKIGIGGAAAFAGSLSGGSSAKEAIKAALEAFDEETKRRDEREKDIQKQTEVAKVAGQYASKEVIQTFTNPELIEAKRSGSGVKQALTPWQQLGAAVRFSPTEPLRLIEKNTSRLISIDEQIKRTNKLITGGNGSGFSGLGDASF